MQLERPIIREESFAKICDSPIEAKLLFAWLELLYVNETTIVGNSQAIHVERGDRLDLFTSLPEVQPHTLLTPRQLDFVCTQVPIDKYRVDFVFGRFVYEVAFPDGPVGRPDYNRGRELTRRLPMLIVECDGHDFHERTKEQAQRDKSRDRRLTTLGFRVLRFTGSEIFHHAHRCAQDIDRMFDRLADEARGRSLP